jgi:adenylate cyclase
VRQVLRTNCQISLGVVPREVTVLFLDIKGFTNIAETTDPLILIDLLSDFFGIMSDIIAGQNGVVDKYVSITSNHCTLRY